LLGPAPASSPAIGLPGKQVKPAAPPPSEFRFSDSNPDWGTSPGAATGTGSIPEIAVSNSVITAPPPVPSKTSPGTDPGRRSALIANGSSNDDQVFKKVYDQFLVVKQECGESIANLTIERFAKKLRANRDGLMAKHGCNEVRFQVYVKDGKAALKATPIKS
ncbi:MAG: MXAN_5187 C-terminal domain-containing protein, partial [Myxococcota bacterium]